ncbi:CDP-glycerol glycerophosphotransferase family protein [Thalassobacillus sp. CUG 92003]|uniref:CDP-glycerol glycerophosphotransferase family protein n=1 Tax=Thalassobacillus sp. CUG 92003 TaxID=2736641 RepID=UPI0015E71CF6|nr:CDP-glycerol glycerophosphotransferase family protein [Thalassobacillus sp. CUG 92003]
MYGDHKLNNHLRIRYGLTKEFFETFSSLSYSSIELPLTMIYHYHFSVIKPFVNKHQTNNSYIKKKSYNFKSMKEVQKTLYRAPLCQKNLANEPGRKAVLVPGAFLPMALKSLKHHQVVLLISNKNDENTIKEYPRIPANFSIFNLKQSTLSTKMPKKAFKNMKHRANNLIRKQKNHEVFGTSSFKRMLHKQIVNSMKQIYVLQNLIRKRKIKIILYLNEYIAPGNILALLAHKFNLTFINVQYYLSTDASIIPSRAHYYCVWGTYYKKWLEERGIAGSKILSIGSLRFEIQKTPAKLKNRLTVDKRLRIPHNHKLITFFTQDYPGKVNSSMMNWITHSISNKPVTVVIKPHRRDHQDYSHFVKHKQIILAPSNFHSYDLLNASDHIMAISSNIAIEGAMFKKGIIILQPSIAYDFRYNYNDFYRHLASANAGAIIRNKHDMMHTINNLLHSTQAESALIEKGQHCLKYTIDDADLPSLRLRRLIDDLT